MNPRSGKVRRAPGAQKIINGTLEFTGDGTALLKFRNFLDVFRVRLDEGTVF